MKRYTENAAMIYWDITFFLPLISLLEECVLDIWDRFNAGVSGNDF